MCGIVGLLQPQADPDWLQGRAEAMARALAHRGPDASGTWLEPAVGLAMGHRRLSIIDLSPAGAQPMESPSGRYVIVFNGEIYNFPSIRAELIARGIPLRGHSDTEVLLGAMDLWGVEPALQRCIGMFAFAAWDRLERRLLLARDRCGEKPLYFGHVGRAFVFASELKAFTPLPGWPNPVDPEAAELYFRHACVPAPFSIHQRIRKLRPAELVCLDAAGNVIRQSTYWTPAHAPDASSAVDPRSDEAAVAELDRRLRGAVERCMVADVPLGAFLSGGLDSSVVVAMMQACSTRPVRTFTIGFDEKGYDEASYAERIAAHLGTQHSMLRVSPADALAVVPDLPRIYDEPFADSSQIPTYLVARMARRDVTVALSGDGGDELFGGYNRHNWGVRAWNRVGAMPPRLRQLLGGAMSCVPGPALDRFFGAATSLLSPRRALFSPGDRIHKLARLITARDAAELYRRTVTHWATTPLLHRANVHDPWELAPGEGAGLAERMMATDFSGYLPDDVLVKLDRASMAVSLESRVPFLDHTLIEFARRLPLRMKIRDGQGKWILRQVLAKYVPADMFERPKMGFALPIDAWLRGPLRDWAENLLATRRLEQHGLLDVIVVRKCWDEHVRLGRQHQAQLWGVLMFQAWHEETFH